MSLGGTDDSAQQLTLKQNQDTLDLIERQTQRATRDVSKLFGSGEQNLLAGNQAALDMMGQYAPQQFSALQQGNQQAQQQLLAGLPQQQAALMGLPTDMSGLQPQQAQVDLSFLQGAQLPQFQTSQQALAQTAPEQAQEQQFGIDAELAKLPQFTRGEGGLGAKMRMRAQSGGLAEALSGLSPEALAQVTEQGPSSVGLGGKTGNRIWQQALAGGQSQNPIESMALFERMNRIKGGY